MAEPGKKKTLALEERLEILGSIGLQRFQSCKFSRDLQTQKSEMKQRKKETKTTEKKERKKKRNAIQQGKHN